MRKLIGIALFLMAGQAFGATCKISEYMAIKGGIPVASEPAHATQSVTYTTSTQSSAFNVQTRFIRVVCDAKAHFSVGTGPTATASDPYLPADSAEYFGVNDGEKIAFYDGSS